MLRIEPAELVAAQPLQGGTGFLPGRNPAPPEGDLLRGPTGEIRGARSHRWILAGPPLAGDAAHERAVKAGMGEKPQTSHTT
jgi:hypothetical protein